MLRLEWSIKALIDFDEAQAYIAQENPFVAQTVADRIWQASQRLTEAPHIGRPAWSQARGTGSCSARPT